VAKTVTATAVRKIITKGLTGREAGKLLLQDLIDCYLGAKSVLTESDITAIQHMRMEGNDVRDYNMFIGLGRGLRNGYMLAEWACSDACLKIGFLDHALRDADKRRTVELFESFGPRAVTRKEFEDIVAAQRVKKLEFEYSLGYVIEERFYAIAPPEVRKEVEDAGVDIESITDLTAAIPEAYADLGKQAVDQIHRLYASGKLSAVYHEEDAREVEPLLATWKDDGLSPQEATKLIDMLYVTGQQLYDCDGLPEWRKCIDQYRQHWCADEDERFGRAYAVLEDCPAVWLDKKGRYKGPSKPSEWITHSTESFLGLIDHRGKARDSIERVGTALRDRLTAAERDVRLFLCIKAVLDVAAEAVELEVPGDGGLLAGANVRLDAFITLYNMRLEELREERKPWESGETRLEKALKLLPAIDVGKLGPSVESRRQLKDTVLNDTRGDNWLQLKLHSLQCGDGVNFKESLD
jgi:hypothetical protein